MTSTQQHRKSRALYPDFCFLRVEDITIDWLRERGIRGLLLDIDNTITHWELLQVPEHALEWIARVQDAGLQVRLLSNGLAHKRAAVATQTGVAQVGGPLFKPLPGFYRRGLAQMELKAPQVLMIGDSVFTDIAGANAVGIWTCLIEPLGTIDFAGTKVYRVLESLLRLRRPLHPHGEFRRVQPAGDAPA